MNNMETITVRTSENELRTILATVHVVYGVTVYSHLDLINGYPDGPGYTITEPLTGTSIVHGRPTVNAALAAAREKVGTPRFYEAIQTRTKQIAEGSVV